MGLGGRQGQSFTQWPPSVITWGPLPRAGDSNTPGLPALLDERDQALVPGAYDWELGAHTHRDHHRTSPVVWLHRVGRLPGLLVTGVYFIPITCPYKHCSHACSQVV